jgi:hypothetical protein
MEVGFAGIVSRAEENSFKQNSGMRCAKIFKDPFGYKILEIVSKTAFL